MPFSLRKAVSLVIFGFVFLSGCGRASSSQGGLAPDFELKDLNGKQISLSGLRGHPVLLDFWATWCGPCRVSIPAMEELYQRHKDQGFQVVGVDMDDDPSPVYAFVKEMHMTYPVVFGASSSVGRDFQVEGLPSFVLIDSTGKVAEVMDGFSGDMVGVLDAEIGKLTAQKP
jgi:thiol-disulfide isomerase/thioredoxin